MQKLWVTIIVGLSICVSSAAADTAHAESVPARVALEADEVSKPQIRDRRFGLGFSLGGGVAGWHVEAANGSASFVAPVVRLGSVSVRGFVSERWSFDIEVPVTDALWAAVGQSVLVGASVYATSNFGNGNVRGLVGPGLELAYLDVVDTASVFSIRPGLQFGVEFLSATGFFGFSILARPFLDVSNQLTPLQATIVGGGATFALGFNYYL